MRKNPVLMPAGQVSTGLYERDRETSNRSYRSSMLGQEVGAYDPSPTSFGEGAGYDERASRWLRVTVELAHMLACPTDEDMRRRELNFARALARNLELVCLLWRVGA